VLRASHPPDQGSPPRARGGARALRVRHHRRRKIVKPTTRALWGAPLLALALSACSHKEDPNVVSLSGRLEAPTVDLAPKVAGRLTDVLVKEGGRVKAGALLVKLDLGDTAVAVDRDRAAVKSAEARLQDLEAGSRTSEIAEAEADLKDKSAATDL